MHTLSCTNPLAVYNVYIALYTVSGCIQTLSDDLARQTGLKTGDCVMALVGGGGYARELWSVACSCLTEYLVRVHA